MPTPVGALVDAAQTISDAYIAAGSLYDMIGLFVAFAIGLFVVGWIARTAKRTVKK